MRQSKNRNASNAPVEAVVEKTFDKNDLRFLHIGKVNSIELY
jgi:hypothetical protein